MPFPALVYPWLQTHFPVEELIVVFAVQHAFTVAPLIVADDSVRPVGHTHLNTELGVVPESV